MIYKFHKLIERIKKIQEWNFNFSIIDQSDCIRIDIENPNNRNILYWKEDKEFEVIQINQNSTYIFTCNNLLDAIQNIIEYPKQGYKILI